MLTFDSRQPYNEGELLLLIERDERKAGWQMLIYSTSEFIVMSDSFLNVFIYTMYDEDVALLINSFLDMKKTNITIRNVIN